jgi:hypothetical protein
MIKYCAKGSRPTSKKMAVTIHAAKCACVMGPNNGRNGYQWGLEANNLHDARLEVEHSESATERGIAVKIAPCAR